MVSREVEPVLAAHPPDHALPKRAMLDLYRAVAPLGYTGARMPEVDGGSGLTHVMLGLLNETLPPVLGFSLLGHESTAKRIQMSGTPAQKARFLPRLLDGTRLGGTATSEPNVGSDPRGIETAAVADGDHYVLNGTKLWITNGPILDVALVVASLGRDTSGRNLITRFIVDREESPFESREIATIGLQQGPLGELHFRECRVPKANLLGEPGDAHRSLTFTWLANRASIGLFGVHLAQKALDASIAHARQRTQFGGPIARFQLVQQMLAEMSTLIDAQPAPVLPRARPARPQRVVPSRVLGGQGPRHRGGGAGDQPRHPAPRELRAQQGGAARGLGAGRADAHAAGRHHPDPAAHHRPRARRPARLLVTGRAGPSPIQEVPE